MTPLAKTVTEALSGAGPEPLRSAARHAAGDDLASLQRLRRQLDAPQSFATLCVAATAGAQQCLAYLLDEGVPAEDPHLSLDASRIPLTPLTLAARAGQRSCAFRLLQSGARPDRVSGSGNALAYAAENDDLLLFQRLRDAALALPDLRADWSDGLLPCAASRGSLAVVEHLLAAGADPNSPLADGSTALHCAAAGAHGDVVRALLAAGASPHPIGRSHGDQPLHQALRLGGSACVRALLDAGANPAAPCDFRERPLHLASDDLDADLLERLYQADPTPHAGNADGDTPLHAAAMNRCARLARWLIDHGAPVDARNTTGVTPLIDLACASRITSASQRTESALIDATARVLLDAGADPSAADSHGKTPLHCAADRQNGALCALLARAGADPMRRDASGRTAFDYVLDADLLEVLRTAVRARALRVNTDGPASETSPGL